MNSSFTQLKQPDLFSEGFHVCQFELDSTFEQIIQEEKWQELDQRFKQLTTSNGKLFKFLQQFVEFHKIEFILSLRDAQNSWEEDGIWHDDGSRIFAFSLSLNIYHDQIEGGFLGIRKKGETTQKNLPSLPFGNLILFLTGLYGYEHKIHKVTKGKRLVVAGWCS